MVNLGLYNAQIDITQCESDRDAASADQGQSSSTGSEFEMWTVRSKRAHNDADQIVMVWVPNEEEGNDPNFPDTTIRVMTVITDGASDSNPFGSFAMDFAAVRSPRSAPAPTTSACRSSWSTTPVSLRRTSLSTSTRRPGTTCSTSI